MTARNQHLRSPKAMSKKTFRKSMDSTNVLGDGFEIELATKTSSGGKKMKKGKIIATIILVTVLTLVITSHGYNNSKEYHATFVNGTGKTITGITLTPAKVLHDNSEKSFDFPISDGLTDKEILALVLPLEMKEFDSFDVSIKYADEDIIKTKKNGYISISKDSSENTFLLSIKGKKSTVPIVSGTTAGGVSIATIAGAAGYCVAHWGAGGLTWGLATIGAGSMMGGIIVVSAIPIAATGIVAGTVYGIQHFLLPETLEVQRLSSEQELILPVEK